MKRIIALTAAVLSFNVLMAQEDSVVVAKVISEEPISGGTSEKTLSVGKVKFKPYGFVRNYFYYDSRQNVQSNAGLYNQIPKDEAWNETHDEDLNDVSTANFLAITSRLGLDISGVRALNADLSAKFETDFCGFASSTTMLRIRQAYMKMKWQHNSILAGQAWHPMSGDLPDVLGLASGSPFQPFSRSPQIRYDYTVGKMRYTLAAIWQFQYKSVGPNGKSDEYQTKAIMPEFFIGLDYANEKGFQIGAGLDMLRIRPRTTTDYVYDKKILVNDTVFDADNNVKEVNEVEKIVSDTTKRVVKEYAFSVSPMMFINYKKDKFLLRWKGVFGQNTAHLNMMSGYGVVGINEDGSRDYAPLRSFSTWLNLSYGSKVKGNLFLGYFNNFGTSKAIFGDLYVNGASNIDYIWRICPAITYNVNKLTLGLEYELTTVGYGPRNIFGEAVADHTVANNRICAMIKYAW